MFCIKCGNAHEEGDRFCTRCGAPIASETMQKLDTPSDCAEETQENDIGCEQNGENGVMTDDMLLNFDLKHVCEPSVSDTAELKSEDESNVQLQQESADAPRKPSLGKRAVISFVFSIVAAQLAILGVFAWIPLILFMCWSFFCFIPFQESIQSP